MPFRNAVERGAEHELYVVLGDVQPERNLSQ